MKIMPRVFSPFERFGMQMMMIVTWVAPLLCCVSKVDSKIDWRKTVSNVIIKICISFLLTVFGQKSFSQLSCAPTCLISIKIKKLSRSCSIVYKNSPSTRVCWLNTNTRCWRRVDSTAIAASSSLCAHLDGLDFKWRRKTRQFFEKICLND